MYGIESVLLEKSDNISEVSNVSEINTITTETYETPENYADCEISESLDSDFSQNTYDSPENYDDCEKADNETKDENDQLKSNIEYTTGEYDYRYRTDEKGRICSFETDHLQLTQREKRLPHDSDTFEKGDNDDAGHLIADRFGGSPNLDNLVSQDSHINRSEYKTMENEWAKAIEDGKKVEIAGEVNYDNESKRPSSFDVFYAIDDDVHEKIFINRRQ
jgi:hypothetical protein